MNHPKPSEIAKEAKAIVALVLRNGPIEQVHAGKPCPVCRGRQEYSHITDEEMKRIIQNAVNHLYRLLLLRDTNPAKYETEIEFGSQYTVSWDDPNPLQ